MAFGESLQGALWTALPGLIQSYNPAENTCVVLVALRMQQLQQTGEWKWIEIKPLLDCPVVFPSGGGATLTFPLKKDDECLVVFASRCIDAWWQNGGVQNQVEFRMHNLSDGFCIPGPRSKPKVPAAISTDHVELRSDDGTAKVRINMVTKDVETVTTGNAIVTASGDVTLAGTNINLNGVLKINGQPYMGHVHTDPQGGNTGGVV